MEKKDDVIGLRNTFSRTFKNELPVNIERVNKSLQMTRAKLGVMPVSQILPDDLTDTVCEAWPKIRRVVNALLKFSWLIPGASGIAPMVKAFLTALDKTIIPIICGTQPPEA